MEPRRHLRLDLGEDLADASHHREDVGFGSYLDRDEYRALAFEGNIGIVLFGAEHYVAHVLQTHQCPVLLLDDEILELLCRVQIRTGREVNADHLALGRTDPGQVIVVLQCGRDILCGDAGRGKLARIEPGTQRVLAAAQQFRLLHAGDGLQLGLNHADHVVGDLVGLQRVAVEAEVHAGHGFAHLYADDRLLGPGRQLVEYRIDLGTDFRQGAVGVVVEAQRGGDRGGTVTARRGEVVDALRLGDGGLDRGGDEARDQLGARAVVQGGYRDGGVFGFWKLADRQALERAEAQQEDQEADHRREHRQPDEVVGEFHRFAYCSSGVGLGSLDGCTSLLTVISAPFLSFSWPLVTISSPSLTPLRIAT